MTPQTPQMPSRGGLLARLAIAALAGAFLVVCVVMPAEYRKDPTGFGRLTGLLELSSPHAVPPAPPPATDAAPATGVAADADPKSASHLYPATFKTETVKIPIGPDGELEYKVKMKAGQSMVYSWEVDRGAVYYDFHGEPADPKQSKSYMEVQETKSAHGTFVAPFDGVHGWFWLNVTSQPLVVTLKLVGFYESHGLIK
ncbi:MAG: hypothetical protein ABI811_17040 [Acidobacteriota bacterium]